MKSNIFTKAGEQEEREATYQTVLSQVTGYRVEDNQIIICGIKGALKHELVIEFYNLEVDYFFNLFYLVDQLEEVSKGLVMRKVTHYNDDSECTGFTLFVQKVQKDSILEVHVPDEEASTFSRIVK